MDPAAGEDAGAKDALDELAPSRAEDARTRTRVSLAEALRETVNGHETLPIVRALCAAHELVQRQTEQALAEETITSTSFCGAFHKTYIRKWDETLSAAAEDREHPLHLHGFSLSDLNWTRTRSEIGNSASRAWAAAASCPDNLRATAQDAIWSLVATAPFAEPDDADLGAAARALHAETPASGACEPDFALLFGPDPTEHAMADRLFAPGSDERRLASSPERFADEARVLVALCAFDVDATGFGDKDMIDRVVRRVSGAPFRGALCEAASRGEVAWCRDYAAVIEKARAAQCWSADSGTPRPPRVLLAPMRALDRVVSVSELCRTICPVPPTKEPGGSVGGARTPLAHVTIHAGFALAPHVRLAAEQLGAEVVVDQSNRVVVAAETTVRVARELDVVRVLRDVLEKELRRHCKAARRSIEAAAVALAALAQCRTAPLAEYSEAVGCLQFALTQTPLSAPARQRAAAGLERIVAPFVMDYAHAAPRLFVTRAEQADFLRELCFNAGIALALCGGSSDEIPQRGYVLYGGKKVPKSFRANRDVVIQTLGEFVPEDARWSVGKRAVSPDAPFEVQVVQSQLARMRTACWPVPSWHTVLALGSATARLTPVAPAVDQKVRNGVTLGIITALEAALRGQHSLEFVLSADGDTAAPIFDGDQTLRAALHQAVTLLNARRAAATTPTSPTPPAARTTTTQTQVVCIGGALGLDPLCVPADMFVAAASWLVPSEIALPLLQRVLPNMRVFFADVLAALCSAARANGRAARPAKPRLVARLELPLGLKNGCKVPKMGPVSREALLKAFRRPAVLVGLDESDKSWLEAVAQLTSLHVAEAEAMAGASSSSQHYVVDVVIPVGANDMLLALDRLEVVFYGSRIGSREDEAEYIRRVAPQPRVALPKSPATGWYGAPGRQVAFQTALLGLAPHKGRRRLPLTPQQSRINTLLSFNARQAAMKALFRGEKVEGDLLKADHWTVGQNVTVVHKCDAILVETDEALALAAAETSGLWRQLEPRPLDLSVVHRVFAPLVLKSATPRQLGRLADALAHLPPACVAEVLNLDKVLALASLVDDEAANAVCDLVLPSTVQAPLRAELLCVWLAARRWYDTQEAPDVLPTVASHSPTESSCPSTPRAHEDVIMSDPEEEMEEEEEEEEDSDISVLIESLSPPPPPPSSARVGKEQAPGMHAAAVYLARALVEAAEALPGSDPGFAARLVLQFELGAKREWTDEKDRNWIRIVRAALVEEGSPALARALDEAVEKALGVKRSLAIAPPRAARPTKPGPLSLSLDEEQQAEAEAEADPVLELVEQAVHAVADKVAEAAPWSRHDKAAAAAQALDILKTALVPMPGEEGGIVPRTERDKHAYKILERMCNEDLRDAEGLPLIAWRKATMSEPMMFAIRKWRDEMEANMQDLPLHVPSRVAKPEAHLCDISLGGNAMDRVSSGFLRDTYKRGGVKLKNRELFLPADELKGIESSAEFGVTEVAQIPRHDDDRHYVFYTPKAAAQAENSDTVVRLTAQALRAIPAQIGDVSSVTIVYADKDDMHLFTERRHPRNPYVSREMGVFLLTAIRKAGTPLWRQKRRKVPQDLNWRLFKTAAAKLRFQRHILHPDDDDGGGAPPRKRRRLPAAAADDGTAAAAAAAAARAARAAAETAARAAAARQPHEDDECDETQRLAEEEEEDEEKAEAARAALAAKDATASAATEDEFWQHKLVSMHSSTRARNLRHPDRQQEKPAFQASTFPTVMRHLLYDLQGGLCRYSSLPIAARHGVDWQASPERLDTMRGYSPDNVVLIARELNHRTQIDPLVTLCLQLCEPMAIPVPAPRRKVWSGTGPDQYRCKPTELESTAPGAKCCGGCNRQLPKAHFSKNATAADGLQSRCRRCQKRTRKIIAYSSEEHHMNALASRARKNARARAKVRPEVGVCEITGDDVMAMFLNQGRRCYYSKLPLKTTANSLFTASLERKDPDLGYTHQNTVLIAACLNTAAQWTPQKFQRFRAQGIPNLRRQVANYGLDMADLEAALQNHTFWTTR